MSKCRNKNRTPEKIGKGWTDERSPFIKRHVVRMDEETFEQVRKLAQENNMNLSEQFRTLVEWGLEAT